MSNVFDKSWEPALSVTVSLFVFVFVSVSVSVTVTVSVSVTVSVFVSVSVDPCDMLKTFVLMSMLKSDICQMSRVKC